MKLVSFLFENVELSGKIEGERIFFRDANGHGRYCRIEDVSLLSPVKPSKIVCVGLNYRDHAGELSMKLPEEPVLFLKPPSALLSPGGTILLPTGAGRVDYEAELAVVIGKTARKINRSEACDFIMGYTCFNDITARELQHKDGQWSRAKGFDTFAPCGPCLETELDVSDRKIKCLLNGKLVQSSSTKEMVFGIFELVEFISGVMTLFPGDIIATGTPPGVGEIKAGDTVEIEVEGLGRLTNEVELE